MSRPLFGRSPTRRPRSVRPLVEALEERCVPSTTASSNGNGVLTITTNSAAANITVAENGQSGSYTVSAADLTGPGVSGGSVSFSSITSIVVTTKGNASADTINFVGDSGGAGPEPHPATILTQGLSVTSAGSLTVDIGPFFNIAGNSTFTEGAGVRSLNVTVSGAGATIGNVTMTGANGADIFSLEDGATITGNFSANLGGGNNSISLGSNTGLSSTTAGNPVVVTGNVAITGTGNDSVQILNATIQGNVTTTGTGRESFLIGNTGSAETAALPVTIKGFLSINDPSAKSVSVVMENTNVGSYMAVWGGTGNDLVEMSNSVIGQNLAFVPGSGNEAVFMNGVNVKGNLFTLGTDTGNESFLVENSHVTGFASINDPNAKRLSVGISNTTVGSYLAIIGGAGNDVASVGGGTTVGENFAIELGAGNNSTSVTGVNVTGNTTLNSGTGNDTYFIRDSIFNGDVTLDTGGGRDTVNIQTTAGGVTQFIKGFALTTGTGNATVNLGQTGGGVVDFFDAGGPNNNGNPSAVFFSGGGTGSTDTLNQFNVNYFGGAPVITGFAHVTG
jgi:hypothetical protein